MSPSLPRLLTAALVAAGAWWWLGSMPSPPQALTQAASPITGRLQRPAVLSPASPKPAADRTAPPPAIAPTAPAPLADFRETEPAWLREAPVLWEHQDQQERITIREVEMKYPLIRTVERDGQRLAMVADHLLVQPAPGVPRAQLEALLRPHGAAIRKAGADHFLVSFPLDGRDALPAMLAALQQQRLLAVVEPDYLNFATVVPNDPSFASQWPLHNTAQLGGSLADADIDAPEAWNIAQGSNAVTVAVIDTGMDLTHPDLAANLWTNPGEIAGNGLDDDHNGYIDDVNGWDFVNRDAIPQDDHYHGTHCAGIIAARGNNALGISGVCWTARLMPLKFLNASGSGFNSDALDAIHYATRMGASVTSNSWGGSAFSAAIETAIQNARDAGALFVVAAGNAAANNDLTAAYPSNYAVENVISVAATDNRDALAYFSSYGAASVHLAAPGVNILSTFPQTATSAMTSSTLTAGYGTTSGTSMAAPHVAGVCALLKSFRPSLGYAQIRTAVLSGADRLTALSSKTATGARLNASRALELLDDLIVSPWSGLTANGPVAGPFTPSSTSFTIANGANWTASANQPWITLSTATGSVTATLNAQANALTAGTYSATITIQNLDRGTTQTRVVTLTIEGVAPMPFVENWESGTMRSMWKNSGGGRNWITGSFTPRGGQHLVLDAPQSLQYNAINELTVAVNLAGYSGVRLQFAAKSLSDEPNGPPPSPYTGSQAYDGVAISVNGTTWYEIQELRTLGSDYTDFNIDLDAALASRGLSYNSTFKIRFNHTDNAAAPEDGIALDDIQITGSPPLGMTLAAPAQLREGLSATCTLTMNPAATTAGSVTLSSPNSDRLIFPAAVSVPAGATNVTFPITTREDAILNGNEEVALTATRSGYNAATARLIAQDNETAVLTLTLPATLSEGGGITVMGRVNASRAPSRDISVALSTSLPMQLTAPVTVTLPAGQTQASFPLIVIDDNVIEGPQNITITASVPNWTSASSVTQLLDDESFSLHVAAPSVIDRFAGVAARAGLISLDGILTQDLVVNLAVAPAIGITVPAQIVVPAGSSTASFDLTVSESNNPTASSSTTLTASAAGFASDSAPLSLIEGTQRVWMLNQPSNDLAYDSTFDRLVVSVPASATLLNGGLARINAVTAMLESLTQVPEELGMLRSSGSTIWAATRSAQRLLRLQGTSGAPSAQIDLGADSVAGSYTATDFALSPSGALAVALRLPGIIPHHAGVAIYDGIVRRANTTARGAGSTRLEFASDTLLLGSDGETTAQGFRTMSVDSSGVAITNTVPAVPTGEFSVAMGRVYASTGAVYDATTLALVTTVSVSGPVCTLPALNRVCWLSGSGLAVYDMTSLNLLGIVPVNGLLATATSLVPAGNDRVAFRTTGGQIFIVRSTLLQSDGNARLIVSPKTPASFVRYGSQNVAPASQSYMLSNPTAYAVNWSASSNAAWTVLGQTSGTLAPHASTALSVSANASSLALGSYAAQITITHDAGSTTRAVMLSVEPQNTPPTITAVADQTSGGDLPIGPLSFTIADAETAAANLTVSASTNNPALLSSITLGGSGTSRNVTLRATPNMSGDARVTLTVADLGASTSTTFNVTVNAVNDPPTISPISSSSCLEDQSLTGLAFTISDPETPMGDLVVSASSSNPALIPASRIYIGGSGGTRTLSLVPLPAQNGSATITVSVSDGLLTATRSFAFTVTAVNDAPTIDTPPSLAYTPAASTARTVNLTGISSGAVNEAQTISISATSSNTALIPSVSVSYTSPASTGALSFTSTTGAVGASTITITVSDSGGAQTVRSFGVRIGVPVITSFTPASGPAGTPVTITGDGFEPNAADNIVYFGAVRAAVLSASSTQLTVLAPAGATLKPLSVTARGLTAQAVRAFRITFPNTRAFATEAFSTVQYLPKTIHTNFTERRVLSADLDGNGSADILAKGATGFEYTLNRIADGVINPGAFDPLVQVPFTSTLSGMITWDYGDLDGDGRLDVVAAGDVGASWFRNNGNGFDPRVSFSTIYTNAVLITDLDADGKSDVVLGESGSVSVFRNTTTTTISFASRVTLAGTGGATSLQCEDMDGDGRRDIVAGVSPNPVVCRATGVLPLSASSFATGVVFASPNTTSNHRTVAADFDGDGKLDLACSGFTGTSSTTPGVMCFFRNTSTPGSLTMDTRVDSTTLPMPSGLEAADLDGDGLPDLVATGYGSIPSAAWKNSNTIGSITAAAFGTRVDIPTSLGAPTGTAIGDLDGDGRPEIMIGNSGQRVIVIKNQFGDSRPVITTLSPTSGPVGTQVTLTGTGFSATNSGNVVYFGSRRATVFNASTTTLTVTVPEGATADPVSVTVNGTTGTSADTFRTTLVTTRVLSATSYGSGSFVGSTTLDTATYANPVTVADVDDDGRNDVILSRTVANAVLIYRNTSSTATGSSATFAAPLTLATRELPYEHRMQDIDVDGMPDLCVVSSTGSMLCIFRNISTPGTIAFAPRLDFAIGGIPQTMECVDYNFDSTLDFVFGDSNFSTGRFFTLLNTSTPGSVSFDPAFVTNFGAPAPTYARQLAMRDFDGDGVFDIANASPSEITTLRGTGTPGDPQFTAAPLVHLWRGGSFMRSADFDSDGKPDILSHETSSGSTGRLSLGRNRATPGALDLMSFTWTFVNWASSPINAFNLDDLDNDSRIDFTVTEGTSNKLLIAQNFSAPGTISMGPFIELPLTHNALWSASGDLNGDGFVDLVASSSRSAGFTFFQAQPPAATPYILPVANRLIYEDQSTGVIPVRVGMEGVDPTTLVLSATTPVTVASLQVGGSGADRTLQITPVADFFGSIPVTLTLVRGTQSVTTSFTITVYPVNDAPEIAALPVVYMSAGTPLDVLLGAVTAGPANEIAAGQTVSLSVSVADATLLSASAELLSSGGVVHLTPAAGRTGSTTISITALDSGGSTYDGRNSTTITTTVQVLDAYDYWKRTCFGDQWANPYVSGDSAAPAGATTTNLLRYALNVPASDEAGAVPQIGMMDIAGQRHATFSHRRRLDDNTLVYELECSTNLLTWFPATSDFIETSTTSNGDGTETVTLRSIQPINPANCLMLRLKVSRAAP